MVPRLKEPVSPRRVWACRNLRTLHIAISAPRKASSSHVSSLIMFGYLSLVCPRLEELIVKRENMVQDDESGLCLLGRLKYLERLQTHALMRLRYPDVAWLRRKNLESGGDYVAGGSALGHEKEQQREEPPETLLERLINGSQNQWVGGHPVTTPSAYLKKLPPLPASQVERTPFLTEDGFDLSGVGRSDDLICWLLETNKDLIKAPDSLGHREDDYKSRDEACLPRLDLLYFCQDSDYEQATIDAEQFMWTQRPEVDFRVDTLNYYG
ncbi:hypothetical protein BGW39_003534 [Mortierella sp. 14UC]|nr:hypothetical protein BGW39_003534 [Mortierella sp. 14UC]